MKLVWPEVHCYLPKEELVVQELANITSICTNKCVASMGLEEMRDYVAARVKAGHHSILEHVSVSVDIVTDRGVTHELVRHRIASFTQKSTRYCGETMDDITFVIPPWCKDVKVGEVKKCPQISVTPGELWILMCWRAAENYTLLREKGWAPEQARTVLPNSLATEIVVTANLREWLHIIDLRGFGTTGRPHPQMRQVALAIGRVFHKWAPWLFKPVASSEPDLANSGRIDV